MDKENNKLLPILITGIIQIIVSLLAISLFSVILNLANIDYKYSPVFASVAISLGAFASSLYMSKKRGNKGYLIGMAVGGITFLLVTIIGLIINQGGLTVNTLFHFIIIMLSAITGGIIGVNKKGKRYVLI